MVEIEDYKRMLTEFIQKQMIILGPNVALATARKVAGLSVSEEGVVTSIEGDSQLITETLVNEYSKLSGFITQMTLKSVLGKYPGIKTPGS
jgi:hypothetical protein